MTHMEQEILQVADCLRQHQQLADIAPLHKALCEQPPQLLLTIARGTSMHAAEYLSYLLMRYAGIPSMSVPLSLNTVYQTPWQLPQSALVLAISQSGGSRDLLESVKAFQPTGAKTFALLNTIPSPLSEVCDNCLNIGAGKEHSVAATKSFIATLSLGIRLFAPLLKQSALDTALAKLPEKIEQAQEIALQEDWQKALSLFTNCDRLYILGRGLGFSIAREAALKFKETCLIQGEAFSSAEVKHGPMALMNERQVVLALAPPDEAQAGIVESALQFKAMGAKVILAADESVAERDVTLIDANHPTLQGLTTIQTVYRFIEQVSRAKGIDTDNPPNLKKVTSTL
ncbi:MAG: SIS domain-containing protein [Cardiobacteriaceae bacterium]|nr:SIS domain-containing protein [Cardiobacteriaceae bacterium]